MHLRHLHQGRELQIGQPILFTKAQIVFPISQSSIDLNWRTMIFVLAQHEGLLVAKVIPSSFFFEQQSLDIWLVC